MQPTPPPWRVIDSAPANASPAESADPNQQDAAGRPSPVVVLALALAGILLTAAFAVAALPRDGSVEVRVTSTAAAGAVAGTANPGGTIVVEVAGAVVRPGVHTLSRGARVGDAIAAAGGYGPRVDADAAGRELNLAALLKDGERIRVPSRDDSAPATAEVGGGGDAGARLLNLNAASTSELEALPGIGPATAAKILAARAQRRFARVDELLERKLVSSKVLEGIRGLVTAN
jgi:competence protein ComEA